ncbi:hypothetical protein E2C01_073048 [Portunus trituberculatus]|uniref:Uncharacterized protein n=1 Tax=Portunus trituberculatus TaxID=210409 RepID=A0A5B7I1S0_PORTR|nr:hypothetical protein [Portunus trituberculatus]
MLFLRQQRINWLWWTSGVSGAVGRMKEQDNVIFATAKDQPAVVNWWGTWGGRKDEAFFCLQPHGRTFD